MQRRGAALVGACLVFAVARCGGGGDDALPTSDLDGGVGEGGGDAAHTDGAAGDDAATGSCNDDATVAAIASCIDGGKSPSSCLGAARGGAKVSCDVDADGMDDALEDAMMRSYAPVFAYNLGDGGHTAGSTEPNWPVSAAHYVTRSTLIWRLDNDSTTAVTVDTAPTMASLPQATHDGHQAASTKLGEGPNFWLCLNKVGGSYPADALVGTMDASRQQAEGIDIFASVHPTSASTDGHYAVLGYMLYYAYNSFTLDDHEGDWEGGAVFVDLDSGDVVAIDTERHNTSDGTKLVELVGANALPGRDPAGEAPHYNICNDTNTASVGGVRFWDFAGKRHHPVFYPSAGAHATYAYPGATKIQGVGCLEATMVRDVHNGNAQKLVPSDGAYYADFQGGGKVAVTHGVHFVNLGEPGHFRAPFTAFAGQWGCTYESIPKSYPGPWDNERLCRHWLTNDWGATPPFQPSTATSCTN